MNRPAKKMHSRLDRHLMGIGILFLLPAAILITFTTLVPIVWNGVLSLCEWNGNGPMEFIGLKNYVKVFTDKATMKTIGNSLVIAAGSTAVSMLLGILLALMIYKTGKREGSIFRFIFYSPSMIPMTVAGLLFVFVLMMDY